MSRNTVKEAIVALVRMPGEGERKQAKETQRLLVSARGRMERYIDICLPLAKWYMSTPSVGNLQPSKLHP